MVRIGGVCGVVFVLGLFTAGAVVSVPTAGESGAQIRDFYRANAGVIVVQQVLSVLILPPFLAFVVGLRRKLDDRQWLLSAGGLVVLVELGTNIPPLILATTNSSSDTAHALTTVEDLADAALFASIAVFSLSVWINSRSWLRIAALAVAAVTFARAAMAPLHLQVLEVAAPLAFLAVVLASSVWLMLGGRQTRSSETGAKGRP